GVGVAVEPGVGVAVEPGVGVAVEPGVGVAVEPGVGVAVEPGAGDGVASGTITAAGVVLLPLQPATNNTKVVTTAQARASRGRKADTVFSRISTPAFRCRPE